MDEDRKRPANEFTLDDESHQRPLKRNRPQPDEEDYDRPPDAAAASVAAAAGAAAASEAEDGAPQEPWTPEMHRDFVEAVFRIGIQKASPNVISQNMQLSVEGLTAERIKSHLQRFRKNKDKSLQEFMTEYNALMSKRLAESRLLGFRRNPGGGSSSASGGHVAADATLASLMQQSDPHFPLPLGAGPRFPSQILSKYISARGVHLPYPNLSDEEWQSPIGTAMYHAIESIRSLSYHLENVRSSEDPTATDQSHTSADTSAPNPQNPLLTQHSFGAESANEPDQRGQQQQQEQEELGENPPADDSFLTGDNDESSVYSVGSPLPHDFPDPF